VAFPSRVAISYGVRRNKMADKRLEKAYQLGKEYEKTYRG